MNEDNMNEKYELKKCGTCPFYKKMERIRTKSAKLVKNIELLIPIIKTLYDDLHKTDYTAAKMGFLNDMVKISNKKINNILDNNGSIEDLRKIIDDMNALYDFVVTYK